MGGGSWHSTGGSDQDHPQEKEMQKGKSEEALLKLRKEEKLKKRRKGKIYPFECRVPKNRKERF